VTRFYAEYGDVGALIRAITSVRGWGAVRVETYTPYPIAEIERALDAPASRLSRSVFAAGLAAAAGAYGLQWLLNAYLYPLDVGGRPAHFPLAFVPITFEMGVLFAALTAFASVLVGARLLRLWHPSSEVEGIESATASGLWLEVEPLAPDASLESLADVLARTEPRALRRVEAP
jgi:hypothetical protein